MSSKYDDLEKLADLKSKGIITEEEFLAKKREILNAEQSMKKNNVIQSVAATTSTTKLDENYGLDKPLSLWNVYKIKNPEQYGGYSLSAYRWRSFFSAILPIIGLILFLITLGNESEVKRTQGKVFLFAAVFFFVLGLLYMMTK
jgi:hypothetical protein